MSKKTKIQQRDRPFRMPDGTITTDEKKYCQTWDRLFGPICKATGATPHGFDPNMQFRVDRDGRFGCVITMPVEFVLALNKALRQ